ncbi:MAG TPA: transglutaminase domain-containing protein, partial [Lachnospiraceae bacterium]|nr:transglutaminase domain-containing protein [Lachnospiraceae bacterium]
TQKVNLKVNSVLEYMDIESMSDYDKVKAIHNYIVKRVSYDESLQASSAYEGIIKKSTVCNGYALLMYKMLNEAGVPARIITGTAYNESGGGNHAWNIVKLGDYWYNIDVTWDDPVGGTKVYYDYFLKGSSDFKSDHYADQEYKTKSFMDKYPISETAYNE